MDIEFDPSTFVYADDADIVIDSSDDDTANEVEMCDPEIGSPGDSFNPTKDVHMEIVAHVLWPRALPNHEHPEMEKCEKEMLALLSDVLAWFETKNILSSRTRSMIEMLCKMRMSPASFHEEVNSLSAGDMLAMYVEKQNSCFVVYMPSSQDQSTNAAKQVIISTFPVRFDIDDIQNNGNSCIQVKCKECFF